ncbi:DUF4383 domain-containing protein [Rhodococcus sp. HNM0563]|uniref:DUF4383 domain-containing protein n=1 Tax=Rhodococcus sp. HNM0563 TaxID=2716339 RepID=UPI00146F671C|nr:DUF4383 domain-containing protein [Rhodococcus sp. HNM0563]NLU63737.1 DUF4383 domain-containing protein [Rhodococcus sp. HNM0563]
MSVDDPIFASRRRVQGYALVVAFVFLIIGVLGFVPGLTSNYGTILHVGADSQAHLLGFFQVSVVHNVVHLTFGGAGVLAARRLVWSRIYLVAGGCIYVALAVYGMLIDHHSVANVLPVNNADNWLHIALGAVMVLLAVDPRGSQRPLLPGKRLPRRKRLRPRRG